jgi:hypothetical protein
MKQQEEFFYKSIDTNLVKSQYAEVFLELRSIVELHDPMQLKQYETEGEYDPEVASILVQLNKDLTEQDVHDLVFGDFTYWFKPVAGEKENYKEISEAIFAWIKKTELNK